MKRIIANTLLGAGFAACIVLAAVTDGMAALLPTFGGVILGIALLDYNTDYIKTF